MSDSDFLNTKPQYQRIKGQVVGTQFTKPTSITDMFRSAAPEGLEQLHPNTQNAAKVIRNNPEINLTVQDLAGTVQPSRNQTDKFLNNPWSHPSTGKRTGKSPEGIRAIIKTLKEALQQTHPTNLISISGATPELHEKYTQWVKKAFPKNYIQGSLVTENPSIFNYSDFGHHGPGNYLASSKINPSWFKTLSKLLPALGATQILDSANLLKDVKENGSTAGYAKWLGLQTYDPTKEGI